MPAEPLHQRQPEGGPWQGKTRYQVIAENAADGITKPSGLYNVTLSVGRALQNRRLELENKVYQQHLEGMVAEQIPTNYSAFLRAITSLAYALETKDKYTSGHSQRVADLAVSIAHQMCLPHEEVEKLRLAALVHDIGKIGVKESVLNKPSCLTKEEFQQIERHPEVGEHILAPVADDEEFLKLVRHHHEWYDGTGYPDRLVGYQIPVGAVNLAVADAYEAMTSERPYREAMSNQIACAEIESGKGTQFDPQAAEAFLGMSYQLQSPPESAGAPVLPESLTTKVLAAAGTMMR